MCVKLYAVCEAATLQFYFAADNLMFRTEDTGAVRHSLKFLISPLPPPPHLPKPTSGRQQGLLNLIVGPLLASRFTKSAPLKIFKEKTFAPDRI